MNRPATLLARIAPPVGFLSLAALLRDAQAQIVTLDFTEAALQAVPLGSGATAGASLLLAVAALYLLGRRKRGGLLAALLALGTALLAAPNTPASAAPSPPADVANFTISAASPVSTGYLGFCFPPGGDLVVTNGRPHAITFTGITLTDGNPVSLAAPPGVSTPCVVGTTLPVGGTCYISTIQTAC